MIDAAYALKLSLQRALLGEVTAQLIAVTAEIKDRHILIRSYFDDVATKAELENFSCVVTEVMADFPEDYLIEEETVVISDSRDLKMLDFWVFLRSRSSDE